MKSAGPQFDRNAASQQYRALLADGIIPFWLRHGVDREFGGVLSCMTEDGVVVSTEKYTWSQARFVWVVAALYNRFEPRAEFLEIAGRAIGFLLANARDERGWFVFRTDRQGRHLEGATSIYADCFVAYGLVEYYRATGEERLLTLARDILYRVRERVEEPDFAETAPYKLRPGRRTHAIPMMLTLLADELAQTTGERSIDAIAGEYAAQILNSFVRKERKLLVEFLSHDYRELPSNEGTFVMPGHAIESMWFILHWARRHGEREMIRRAVEVIRWHLEAGWDPEFGGIFLGIDAEGQAPFLPNAEKKLWWPHTEALYALLLAHELTNEAWCLEWYERVHLWTFERFPIPGVGEWRQRLDRQGRPTTDVIALPVKDPFHLPRAAILILQLLERRSL
ncbi:MAG TPA: AGE family epimerase/isomerase [Bryobacteraceae bacterium]|nr:AGE family epimerase/isomerase [Bryobacteraceae bacterium]